MQGILTVPPDRGTILGRAVWKPRFVTIGNESRDLSLSQTGSPSAPSNNSNLTLSQAVSATTKHVGSRSRGTRARREASIDGPYVSVYKSQMLAHRKQGPVLPTLVLQMFPDPTTDKLTRRRSSRATLMSNREATILWFRLGEDHQYTLHDWARYINTLMQSPVSETMSSPMSPTVSIFSAQMALSASFGPLSSDGGEYGPRPASGGSSHPRQLLHKHLSQQTQSSRERSFTFTSRTSESLSVRSGRSDMSSSRGSSMNPAGHALSQATPGKNYTVAPSSELPSPASTRDDYPGDPIEGWAGRCSMPASTRLRGDSMISEGPVPPLPRETILDRAFLMKCIPGPDQDVPGEESMSSLAKFDALMEEVEARRKPHARPEATVQLPTRRASASASEHESDSDSEKGTFSDEVDDDDEYTDDDAYGQHLSNPRTSMGPSTSRSLSYLAMRHSMVPAVRPVAYRSDSPSSHSTNAAAARPHTAHSKAPFSPAQCPSDSAAPAIDADESRYCATAAAETATPLPPSRHRHRHSVSTLRRVSSTEFKQLLGQAVTTAAGTPSGSTRLSGDAATPRPLSREASLQALPARSQDELCAWRASIGFIGGEGGFI